MATGVQRFDEAIAGLISKKLFDVHTSMPCVVTSINLGKEFPTCDVQILWEGTNDESSSLNYKYPEIYEVPIYMPSVSPTIKITLPVKIGTLGTVLFPEKPMRGFNGKDKVSINVTTNRESFPLTGILFIPSYHCGPIDSENIIIQNETSIITIKKDSISVSAPTGMTVNGATITPDGDVVTASGVSLNNVKTVYNSHTHGGGPTALPQL